MPNRSPLDAYDGPVHPGNLGWVRSTTLVSDGARAGGRYTAGRAAAYLDVRDEGHGVDVHRHLRERLLPHRMPA